MATLKEFIEHIHQKADSMEKAWTELNEQNPIVYPDELPLADWYEQLDMVNWLDPGFKVGP